MDNYSAEYHGIRLSYGLSCDHNIYVVPFRGGQLINIKNDGTFTVQRLIRHRGQSTVTIGKEKSKSRSLMGRLNLYTKNTKAIPFSEMAFVFTLLPLRCIFSVISCLPSA